LRKTWIVPALGLALLLVLLLLLGERGFLTRKGGGLRGEDGNVPARTRAPAASATGRAGLPGAPPPSGTDPTAESGPPLVTVDGHLVYGDGAPAAGIDLHLAICRSLKTRRFRNGEYTDLTIQLVTAHVWTDTKPDGSFAFGPVREPPGARRFVFTKRESPAFVVAELLGNGQTVIAAHRVSVTGRLRGRDGNALPDLWFEAQLGKPEDWQTRVLHEEDSFITATGDLQVDTLAKNDTRSHDDGSFDLLLAEGRNTFTFGEAKTDGVLVAEVPRHAIDVGEMRVPGPGPRLAEHSVAGTVLDLAGAPNAGCAVRAWDGSVGMYTHETLSDDGGAFSIEGLTGSYVILWAVSTERRHIYLPSQTSGTLRPPCAPIMLQAPAEEEYAWAHFAAEGFYVFLRDRVFLGGDALGPSEVVGLPPGPLHIYLLATDARILEASITVREPGDLTLGLDRFREATWE